MATEERQYAGATVATARSQVGYNPGRTNSKYGTWYGLANALWCACGGSWCAYIALGTRAAKAILGAQPSAPNGRGYAWTVKWREHLQATGTKVLLRNAQPGDVLFFKYPTADGRNGNVVNHVDLVSGNATATYIPTIGFNTPRPGSGGDPSNGRGVWNHNRALADRYIVDCYRPPWWRHPDLITYVQGGLGELGYDPGVIDGYWGNRTEAAVTAFQKAEGLTVDKVPGPHTRATIALRLVDEVLPEITEEAELMAAKDEIIAAINDATTVDVSEATARNLWTGRTGRQPIGWFLNVLGNRIGRTDGVVHHLREQSVEQAGALAGLQESVTQLAEKSHTPIDLEAVAAASQRGTEAALRKVGSVTIDFGDEDTQEVAQ